MGTSFVPAPGHVTGRREATPSADGRGPASLGRRVVPGLLTWADLRRCRALTPRRRLGPPLGLTTPVADGPVSGSVAVIIPLYNYGRYLPEAVGSAVAQDGVDVHVVIVDDASTDDSYDVAVRLAAEHSRVTLLRNDRNRGPGETFNRGWRQVETDYVLRLDPDDVLAPGALGRAAAVLRADPAVGLVYGRPVPFVDALPIVGDGRDAHAIVWSGHDWVRHLVRGGRNLINTPEAVMRRDVLETHGGWRSELRHTQDLEAWMRFATYTDVAHVEGAVAAFKRTHADSLSRTEGNAGTTGCREHLDALLTWHAYARDVMPNADRLLEEGRRAIALYVARDVARRRRRGDDPSTLDALDRFSRDLVPADRDLDRLRRIDALAARRGGRILALPWAAANRARERAVTARWEATGT